MSTVVDTTLRVPMYTPTPSGGHARYTKELLTAMADQGAPEGVQVSLVTSEDLDPAFRTTEYPIDAILPRIRARETFRSRPEWLLSRLRFYWRRNRMFIDWAIANRASAVHFQEFNPWTAPHDVRRLRRNGVRVFATVHHVRWVAPPPMMPKWLPNIGNRLAWRACDGLFVHSESTKSDLESYMGGKHPPIWVTPHGVWTPPGKTTTPQDAEARLAQRQLLFFGVVTPYKGVDVLLRALEHLPDFSLVVAGASDDAAYAAELRELAAKYPPGRVRIEDRFLAEDEIGPLFDACSLVVLPYLQFASQSGVLHDAVAHGIPVVASDFGAIGESIRTWGTGEVVQPGDPVDLARGVRAATEPEAYVSAVAAAERVREEKSWQLAAKIVIDAYGQVLRGRA